MLDGYRGMVHHNISNEDALTDGLRKQVELFCRSVISEFGDSRLAPGPGHVKTHWETSPSEARSRARVGATFVESMRRRDYVAEPCRALGKRVRGIEFIVM